MRIILNINNEKQKNVRIINTVFFGNLNISFIKIIVNAKKTMTVELIFMEEIRDNVEASTIKLKVVPFFIYTFVK